MKTLLILVVSTTTLLGSPACHGLTLQISFGCLEQAVRGLDPSTPDISSLTDSVKSQLESKYSLITAFDVTYTSTSYGDSAPPGSFLYRRVAAKSPNKFFHMNSHGHDLQDWQDDPSLALGVVTDKEWRSTLPLHRAYMGGPRKPTDDLPHGMGQDVVMISLGIWPLEMKPPRFGTIEVSLLHACQRKDYKVALEGLVGDEKCVALCNGDATDRIWVLRDQFDRVLGREFYDASGKNLICRFDFRSYREVGGVELPLEIHQKELRSGGGYYPAVYRVINISINESVDGSLFDFNEADGMVKLGISSDISRQVRPGGEDEYFRQLTAWACRSGLVKSSTRKGAWKIAGVYLVAIVVAVCTLVCRRLFVRVRTGDDLKDDNLTVPGN